MALKFFSRMTSSAPPVQPGTAPPPPPPAPPGSARGEFQPADAVKSNGDGLQQALAHGRFGVIAYAPGEWKANANYKTARTQACKAIDDRFALVPDGFVAISMTVNGEPGGEEQDVETGAFLLARHAVSNADYQKFVDSGGYEELSNWDESAWPQIVNFKDRTGKYGPRFWQEGRHDRRMSDHPVIGVSYIEAQSYCRWAGYRLPTESEWQMAASWRIKSESNVIRRYPWGDALDLECCNIWYSGHGNTLPVTACPGGAAPNGVVQLIGNVWEWTRSEFTGRDMNGRPIMGDMLMNCIRGGAYDTYFPWQATSTFRSAAPCMSRAHNVGFRCALDLHDD